jgi:hypothetical protein
MVDNLQDYLNIALGVSATVFGWFGRTLWGAVQDLKKDLSDLQRHLPENYVAKQDFQRSEDRIVSILNRIEAKIDSKADKEK